MLTLKYRLKDGSPNRRRLFGRLSLRRKLPILIAVPFVLLASALCVVDYALNLREMEAQRAAVFESMLTERAAALETWHDGIETDLITLAASHQTGRMVKEFQTAWDGLGEDPGAALQRLYIDDNPNAVGEKDLLDDAGDGSFWSRLHATYHPGMRTLQRQGGYYDVFLFDLQGNLIYTVFKEADFGTNFATGPYADSGLGHVFAAAREAGRDEVTFSKFAAYAPSAGAPAAFAASPVFDATGARIGVAAVQIPVGRIAEILSESALLGETGLVYLVGSDGRARSDSGRPGGHRALDQLPDLPQIAAALRDDHSVLKNVRGLQGGLVEAQGRSFGFGGDTWAMVREMDMTEAGARAAAMLRFKLAEIGIVALVALAVGLLLARMLTRRISELAHSVEEVAQGHLAHDVNQVRTGDEIGDIARTLLLFKDKLTLADEVQAKQQRMMTEQQQVVQALQTALENLAQGVLDCRIDVEMGADYESLRLHFNAAVEELTQIIGRVSATAVEIESDTERLTEASEQLSIRTENQAATLEQSTAALQQITTTVQASAGEAQSIVSVIEQMRSGTDRSSAVKNRAVEAMSRIEESSKKIAQIIGVIEDIAFQTNLLALNAGVEAARAGEVGRGFAVVASEVRALAQRSHDSAGEIRDLISASAKSVQDGVELVSDLGEGIDEISAMTRDISGRVQSIASSTEDQSRSLSDINTGVSELDGMTQKNAGMVMEFNESGKTLNAKALELRRMVAHFKGDALTALERTAPIPAEIAEMAQGPADVSLRRHGTAPRSWDDTREAPAGSAAADPGKPAASPPAQTGGAAPVPGSAQTAAARRQAAAAGPWQDF